MKRFDKTIRGTKERPRLVVTRSLSNVYAQVIDDESGNTLVGISSKSLKEGRANKALSEKVGEIIAEKAIKLGVKQVVFDRAGKIFHGRVKAVAEGARKKGLKF